MCEQVTTHRPLCQSSSSLTCVRCQLRPALPELVLLTAPETQCLSLPGAAMTRCDKCPPEVFENSDSNHTLGTTRDNNSYTRPTHINRSAPSPTEGSRQRMPASPRSSYTRSIHANRSTPIEGSRQRRKGSSQRMPDALTCNACECSQTRLQ